MTTKGRESLWTFRSLIDERGSYDTSSGTYAIPIEAFDALVKVAQAAAKYIDELEHSGMAEDDDLVLALENLGV